MGTPGDCPIDEVLDSPDEASAVFDLLADHRRRVLLYCLRDPAAESIELDALLPEWADRCPGRPDGREPAVEAHHLHLPKLDAAGVVDYDRSRRTIRYLGHPFLESCLDCLRELDVEA